MSHEACHEAHLGSRILAPCPGRVLGLCSRLAWIAVWVAVALGVPRAERSQKGDVTPDVSGSQSAEESNRRQDCQGSGRVRGG